MTTTTDVTTADALAATSIALGLLLDGLAAAVESDLFVSDARLGEAVEDIHAAAAVLAEVGQECREAVCRMKLPAELPPEQKPSDDEN